MTVPIAKILTPLEDEKSYNVMLCSLIAILLLFPSSLSKIYCWLLLSVAALVILSYEWRQIDIQIVKGNQSRGLTQVALESKKFTHASTVWLL